MLIEIAEDFWVDSSRIIHADNRSSFSANLKVDGEAQEEGGTYYCEAKARQMALTMAPIIAAAPGFFVLQCVLPDLSQVQKEQIDRISHAFQMHRIPIPAWRMWCGELEPVLFGRTEHVDTGCAVLHPNGTVVARTMDDAPSIFATEAEWMQWARLQWIADLEWAERQAAKAAASEASK